MNGEIINRRGPAKLALLLLCVGTIVVVAVLLKSSATGDSRADPSTRPTSSSTPSDETSSSSEERPQVPVLPSSARTSSLAGAASFARYFFEIYNFSFATLDVEMLAAVSATDCRFCASLVRNVSRVSDIDGRAVAGEIVVLQSVAAPGSVEQGVVVNVLIDQRAGSVVDGRGETVSTVAPSSDRRVDVRVRWQDGAWKVVEVDARPSS